MAEVIAVTSGKGGMGKTAITAAVAVSLAADGKRVLCIDCHDGMGDLDAYLGFGQLPDLTYPEICRGLYPLERAALHPDCARLRFLAAPAGESHVSREQMASLLRQASVQFDYILLDNPQFDLADRWLLITQPNPAAIRGARRRADALEVMGARNVRMIVNAIDSKQMAVLKLNVDDVMDGVGLPLLGIVPHDPAVTFACAKGEALRGNKGAAAAACRIARRIQGIHTSIPSRL